MTNLKSQLSGRFQNEMNNQIPSSNEFLSIHPYNQLYWRF